MAKLLKIKEPDLEQQIAQQEVMIDSELVNRKLQDVFNTFYDMQAQNRAKEA